MRRRGESWKKQTSKSIVGNYTHTHAHVWALRYGFGRGITPTCIIHDCFPSFWSETWKREFCPEKKQNGWTHQYPDNTRLPIRQVDTGRGDRDDKLHKDVLFLMAVRAILLHCLFVFICIVWILLCGNYGDVIFMFRLEEKTHRVKKSASHGRGFSTCECLKKIQANSNNNDRVFYS